MRTVPASGPDELHYLLSDHLGSTTKLLDDQGGVVSEVKYWPYGGMRSGGITETDKLYTGQQIEPSTTGLGLYNYGARFYSTTLGRFLSVDPVVPEVYNPQDWNGYAYVRNNPMRYIDPTGMVPTDHAGNPVWVSCNRACEWEKAAKALEAHKWVTGQMVNTCGPTCRALHAIARHRQNVIGALQYWQQVRRNEFLAEVRREHNQRMREGMLAAAAIAAAEAAKNGAGRSIWGSVKGVVSGGAGALVDGVSACLDSTVCKTAVVTVGVVGCTAAAGGATAAGCVAAGAAVMSYSDMKNCAGGSATACGSAAVGIGLSAAGGGAGAHARGLARGTIQIRGDHLRYAGGNVRVAPLGGIKNWKNSSWAARLPHYHRRGPGGIAAHHPWEHGF
jgi:RHS repeat-associated protein